MLTAESVLTAERETDRLGREREWEREIELVVSWLEEETLRDLADDSSCDSDTDCCSDLMGHTAVNSLISWSVNQKISPG